MQQIITPTDASNSKPLAKLLCRWECFSMLRRICKYAAHLQPDSSNGAGSCAAKKAIDKISAPLFPGGTTATSSICTGEPHASQISAHLLLGLELGLPKDRLVRSSICTGGLQWGDFDLKLGTLNINRTVCRISCGNGHTKVVIQTPKTPHLPPGNSNPETAAYYAEKAARKHQQCCMVPVRQRVQAHRTPLLSEKHQSISEAGDCPSSAPARAAPHLCNDLPAGGVRCKDPQRIVGTCQRQHHLAALCAL